jgi:hypothetical protein
MSADYFLEQMTARWKWGGLDELMIQTRSADILSDWKSITRTEADEAVQLLRRREHHKGDFMPSADEIEYAVCEARKTRSGGGTPSDGFKAADALVTRRHSVTGKVLGSRASHWAKMEAFYGSADAAIDAYHDNDHAAMKAAPRLSRISRRITGEVSQ